MSRAPLVGVAEKLPVLEDDDNERLGEREAKEEKNGSVGEECDDGCVVRDSEESNWEGSILIISAS